MGYQPVFVKVDFRSHIATGAFLTLQLAWDLLLGGFVELVCFPSLWKSARGLVMDDRMQRDVSKFVARLAKSQHEQLAAAGTFVDIEDLTAEIGDEVARQLANLELSRRSEALCEQPTHACPECGKECTVASGLEPIILQGMRGEIEYGEPRRHCSRCRRDFFPSGRTIGETAARERDAETP